MLQTYETSGLYFLSIQENHSRKSYSKTSLPVITKAPGAGS